MLRYQSSRLLDQGPSSHRSRGKEATLIELKHKDSKMLVPIRIQREVVRAMEGVSDPSSAVIRDILKYLSSSLSLVSFCSYSSSFFLVSVNSSIGRF